MLITAASIQDRDAAKPLLWNLKKAFPAIRLAWADGIYAGKLVAWAITALKLTLQIVDAPMTCTPLKSCPAAGSLSAPWPGCTRCRRTVRDYERLPEHHETIVYWAMVITMSRRLARRSQPAQPRAA